jgi:hypothetical protein
MSLTISTLARCVVPVTVALAGFVVPGSNPGAWADGGTVVPMRGILRACDFNPIPDFASINNATVAATIHNSGGAVTADIHFAEAGNANAHYDVSLIQLPRPSTAPCEGPGPGVAVGSLNTDGVGVGDATIRDTLHSGTTGVWVFIRQPSPRSQSPAEFYTSDFPAKV